MVTLKRVEFDHPDFVTLRRQLDKELEGRYGEQQKNLAVFNYVNEETNVVLAYVEGMVVGCGCFRRMPAPLSVEIKRMYVRPENRGQGMARMILAELEKWARQQGYKYAFLETGIEQPEAVAAYTHAGYKRIDNYPPYQNSWYSICMKKVIS